MADDIRIITEDEARAWYPGQGDTGLDQFATAFSPYHYTGSQAQIYINDYWIDEMTALYFSEVTNKTPIFGYTSQTFDRVACGNRMVRGWFTINYVDEAYLKIVAQDIYDRENADQFDIERPDLRTQLNLDSNDDFIRQKAINEIRGLGNPQFRRFAEQFRADENAQEFLAKRFDAIPPFTIFMLYGDPTSRIASHTAGRITGVELIAHERIVQTGDDVVQERYEFIGKEVLAGFQD